LHIKNASAINKKNAKKTRPVDTIEYIFIMQLGPNKPKI